MQTHALVSRVSHENTCYDFSRTVDKCQPLGNAGVNSLNDFLL